MDPSSCESRLNNLYILVAHRYFLKIDFDFDFIYLAVNYKRN